DAEVEHTRALREELAQRRVEQRRPVRNAGRKHDDEQRAVHAAGSAAGTRPKRTRYRTSSSPPSAENRMIPCITPTSPDGKSAPCSVLPAFWSAPMRNATTTQASGL